MLSQLYAAHEEGRPVAGLSVMVRDPVTVEGRDGSLIVKSAQALGGKITFDPICGWLHLCKVTDENSCRLLRRLIKCGFYHLDQIDHEMIFLASQSIIIKRPICCIL